VTTEETEHEKMEKERDLLLLRAGFAAWKPDGKLSTSNFLKSSIARILMRSEQAIGAQPAQPSNELPQSGD
jgi:hypothetical protein